MLVFKQNLTSQWGIPVRSQRLWLWARCRNGTLRLSEPMDSGYDDRQMCDIVSLPLCSLSHIHQATLALQRVKFMSAPVQMENTATSGSRCQWVN